MRLAELVRQDESSGRERPPVSLYQLKFMTLPMPDWPDLQLAYNVSKSHHRYNVTMMKRPSKSNLKSNKHQQRRASRVQHRASRVEQPELVA
jgi:hypothetical protein